MMKENFPNDPVVSVPEDSAIRAADSKGVAPFDFRLEAPAVRRLCSLAFRSLKEIPKHNTDHPNHVTMVAPQ